MEAVGRMAGAIAHDFNNILTAVSGYATLLKDELPPNHDAQSDVQGSSTQRPGATALTRQLLAFSRRQVLHPQVVDLGDTIDGIMPMIGRLIGENIAVAWRRPASPTRLIEADPTQLDQVVLNLALNARDAMPDGGTITIEIDDVELDPDYARTHFEVHARAVRPAGRQRHGDRDGPRDADPRVRAVLHDEEVGTGHGSRPGHGLRHRQAEPRRAVGVQRTRPRLHVQGVLPAGRGPPDPPAEARRSAGVRRWARDHPGRRGRGGGARARPDGARAARVSGARGRRRSRGRRGRIARAARPAPHRRDHARPQRTRDRHQGARAPTECADPVHVGLYRRRDRSPQPARAGRRTAPEAVHAGPPCVDGAHGPRRCDIRQGRRSRRGAGGRRRPRAAHAIRIRRRPVAARRLAADRRPRRPTRPRRPGSADSPIRPARGRVDVRSTPALLAYLRKQ